MRSLYRRYRPLKLEEVIGQTQVTRPLASALAAGKIGHAYLFIGPRGCGKTSVARIFAHAVNEFDYQLEDDYVDIIEIDGASNRGIDNIRELREKAAIAPTNGKYKIYIIDEVHMLTKEAFNALLKTLEEPPAHVIFIMATTDAYKVPVTITSRAQTFTFKLADTAVMLEFLKSVASKENIPITDAALEIIAKRGGGSFRDALSLLDQISTLSKDEISKEMVESVMGLPEDAKLQALLAAYASGDIAEVTELIKDLLRSGVKPETLAEELIRAVVAEPRPEFLPLLAKLPEVKEPFAEARLLVALAAEALRQAPQNIIKTQTNIKQTTITAVKAEVGCQSQPAEQPEQPEAKELEQPEVKKPKAPKQPAAQTSAGLDLDWDGLLEQIKALNDTVHIQLTKCEHEVSDGALHLYPRTKMVGNILKSKNNQQILLNNVGGLKVTVHSPGEHPKSAVKDAVLDKISGIMGGEVISENGGYSPF